ncbi:flavocytochrome c [Lachnospiraceae bacterium C1.1]|nr:flavocytochrome c [Lachnospiraceae bacterium C1.1]
MSSFGKKVLSIAIACVFCGSLIAYTSTHKAQETAQVGADTSEIPADAVTAEGSAQGMDGEVKVEVVATADRIYSVAVTEENETEGIGSKAVESIPGAIYEAQCVDVDAVTGATITSTAIKEAVSAAITSAGFDLSVFQAGGAAASAAAATAAPEEKKEDATYDTDIVIVGAGGAGMTAAIEAADAGKKVVLIESQPMVGGNSVLSTGGLNAAKTKYQDENEFAEADGVEKQLAAAAEKYSDNETITELAATVKDQWDEYQASGSGYFDSTELFELDTMIGGKGINDPELVKTLCEGSADAIDWLGTIGADVNNVSSFGGASVKRIHRPVGEDGKTTAVGAYIVPILEKNIESRENITLLLDTTAKKIITDSNGAAVGIEAEGSTGEKVTVNSKAVVMTTGGFGGNLDKVVEYKPELKGFMSTNASGAQGTGIDMGVEIGAATVDLDQIQIHPTVEANSAHLITEGLRGDGAILVNAEGKRFTDEVGTRDVVSEAEIQQTGGKVWLIMDQDMADASSVIQGYINAGYTKTGETYAELADEMGVDAAAFEETMNAWNECVDNKSDPEYGRTSFADKLDTAPYYAINVTPGIHHTMGGLKINSNTEVLDESGNVIPGFFAAGEVTGGVHGANRLGGNAVCDFTVYGRIAGQNSAAFVK